MEDGGGVGCNTEYGLPALDVEDGSFRYHMPSH